MAKERLVQTSEIKELKKLIQELSKSHKKLKKSHEKVKITNQRLSDEVEQLEEEYHDLNKILIDADVIEPVRTESQYCKLTIKAFGTDVKYQKVTIEKGKHVNHFDNDDLIKNGTKDWAKWQGSWGTPRGTEGTVYFEMDSNNKFSYKFHSTFSGKNQSEIREGGFDKKKYKVEFEEKGNISRDGALGHVIIKVIKI